MAEQSSTPDRRVAWCSGSQHGVISIGQLKQAGLSHDAIHNRVRNGRLHRLYRGVYAVGHRGLSVEGRWMAAVLACGERAALSHRSAAALWGMLPKAGPAVGAGGPIDVLAPFDRRPGRRPGIRLHRSRSLTPGSIVRHRGIAVTSPARTIADLRGAAPAAEVRQAIRQAEALGLRTELAPRPEPTRSELEDVFLALCRRHRIPAPDVNRRIAGHEVDFSWPRLRVAVETDGYRFHRGRSAFEGDRERDLDLRAAGYDVIRLTHRQLTADPGRCAATVRAALAKSQAPQVSPNSRP